MKGSHRLRQFVNVINLSTLLGLLAALLGRCRLSRGPEGLILARGYRLPIPPAPAFTLGNVIMLRLTDDRLARRPQLIKHESKHATQYAWCLGPLMLIGYLVASAWSWMRTGDPASRNVFEVRAGLADGGYRERPLRRHQRTGSPT